MGKPFNIVKDNDWIECRFSRIVQLIGEKLQDAKKRKYFIDTFKAGYNS